MRRKLADIETQASSHGPLLKRLIVPQNKKGKLINMNYVWLKKDEETLPHSHKDCEEYFLLLEGEGEITLDNRPMSISKGDFVNVPSGKTHVIKNVGGKTLYFLTFLILTTVD